MNAIKIEITRANIVSHSVILSQDALQDRLAFDLEIGELREYVHIIDQGIDGNGPLYPQIVDALNQVEDTGHRKNLTLACNEFEEIEVSIEAINEYHGEPNDE